MDIKSSEDFEKETGLPATAKKRYLEILGAKHLFSEPFKNKVGQLQIIEFLFLPMKENEYVWVRVAEAEARSKPDSEFKIHASYLRKNRFKHYPKSEYSTAVPYIG